jgi:hypothetical protein
VTDRSVAIRLATDGKEQVKRDLTEIGDAGDAQARRWQKSYDQAGSMIDAAIAKQQQAAQKLAAIVPSTSAQQIYQAGASTNYTGGSARDSAAALKQLLDEQDRLAASAAALKARIDPLSVAQARYDNELREASTLLAAGKISQSDYTAQIALSERTLNTARRTLGDHSNALGFNRMQFLIAEGAAHRYVDSILAGMSPMRAFMMQAGDVGNILAMDDGGVAGGLTKVRALINPVTIGISAATAAVAVGTAAWYSYSSAVDKLNAVAQGSGRLLGESGAQLEANAEDAANAANITVGAARDIEKGYLAVAKSGDVLTGLTAITKDFAAATGQDLKSAQQQLAAAFDDTIAGAQQMAEKYGALTQQQVDYIASLVEEGRQTDAQRKLLDDLGPAFDNAAAHADVLTRGWRNIEHWASEAFVAMGKAIDLAAKGPDIAQKIAILQGAKAEGPSFLQRLAGTTTASFNADIDRQIAAFQYQLRQVKAQADRTKEVGAASNATSIVDQYTGGNVLDDYKKNAGILRMGLATSSQLDPQQRAAMTASLKAYNEAIDSFITKQDKANQESALDAKIAAAKTPAQKSALAYQKSMVETAGEVMTAEDRVARAHAAADAAAAHATHTNGAHAASLARQAESMAVAAKASLTLADAYLTSSAAGIEADARRRAATDATRKGIDVEAQAQRQLNLDIAQAVANGAKSVDQLRGETAAREAVNAQVSGGTLAASRMNQALSDEAALRPLLTLRAVAQGDALKELNKVIDAYTAALDRAHAAETHSDFLSAMDQSRTSIADLTAGALDLSQSKRDQAIAAARRAATNYAADHNYSADDTKSYVDQKGLEAAATYAADMARSFDQQYRSNKDNLALAQAELSTFGMSADQRQLILSHLQHQIQLQHEGRDLSSDDAKVLLQQGDALDLIDLKLRAVNDNWQELTQAGDQLLGDVLDPRNWDNWGAAADRVINDLETEFMKLAALNPLKNLLFGESNPTLGGIGGLIGKLIGGGSGLGSIGGSGFNVGSIDTDIGFSFGHNAAGTQNWSGGATWVNENGPEIADLPSGTRIYPASETRRMLAAAANDRGSSGPVIKQTFNNNFAGGAATMQDVQQMGQIAYQGAINAIRESDRRRG